MSVSVMEGYRVWVSRHIVFEGYEYHFYCRKMILPIPPFPGMGLQIDWDCDPEEVTDVAVHAGAVVVHMETETYTEDDGDWVANAADRKEHLEFLTDGWTKQDRIHRFLPFTDDVEPWPTGGK